MIAYTVRMSRPHSHILEVEVAVREPRGETTDFVLPSWTPGSYMIREYARHVQGVEALADGKAAPWTKTAKDTWRVTAPEAAEVRLRFGVYAHDLTVRTCHLDGTHAFFTGAALFPFVAGRETEPVSLAVHLPDGWSAFTGLESGRGDPGAPRFRAADYDELVDCPVECGPHRVLAFEVDGRAHRIVLWGKGNEDESALVRDVRAIVGAQRDFFGGLPYRHYTFVVHLASGRGGLEHRNSTVLLVDRFGFRPRDAYERFLSLVSHEFFHVWNVKRIRPEPLGPFDYRRENLTRQLWTMEGVTTYYEKRFLLASKRITPERFLERIAEDAATLQSQPGRTLQSLEQSSFDAWIKLYRPDENSANSSISYYLKGGLVATLLDLEIRHATDGEFALDDVVRFLHARYPVEGPGFAEEGGFLAAVEEIAGSCNGAFRRFFERFVAGTDELPFGEAFARAGLRTEWSAAGSAESPRPWLGIKLESKDGKSVVTSARSDGPAFEAGVYAGDELLALDGFRVDAGSLAPRLASVEPGTTVRVTVFRRDELVDVPVVLAPEPAETMRLVPDPAASREAAERRKAWIGI